MPFRGEFHFADRLAAGRTLMAERRNVVHRPQGMAGWILNATVEGSGSIGGGEGRYRSRVGELLLFAPTAVHDYGCDQGTGCWVHLWVYFYPRDHWQPWLRWPAIAPGILRQQLEGAAWDEVRALFARLVEVVAGGQAHAIDLGMCLLEQILILGQPAPGGDALDPRIAHAIEWLSARYAQPLQLADLAAACAMSPSRLSHRFREQVGIAPMRFLERLRIDRAREQLVMSGRPIAEVAAAVGFDDPDWFARVFRRHTGTTPRAFRQRAATG